VDVPSPKRPGLEKGQSLQRTDTVTQLQEILTEGWLSKLIYIKNVNRNEKKPLSAKLKKLGSSNSSQKALNVRYIGHLRDLRRHDSPYQNAFIENAVRHIRESKSTKANSLEVFEQTITELYSFSNFPPSFNDEQIETISLGEFTDVMGGKNEADREELRKFLFPASDIPVAEQKKSIWHMVDFVQELRECSDPKERKALIASVGEFSYGKQVSHSQIERDKGVLQFCKTLMEAIRKGADPRELPGCGIGIERIAERLPIRKKELFRAKANKENPQQKIPVRAQAERNNSLQEVNQEPKNIQQ
jgi:hypothetical protein